MKKPDLLSLLEADEALTNFRERLFTLQQDRVGTPSIDGINKRLVFQSICSISKTVFPDPKLQLLTDKEIKDHPATPDLVRYMITAMDRFHSESVEKGSGLSRTMFDAILGRAFFTQDLRVGYKMALRDKWVNAALEASQEARAQGKSTDDSYNAGLNAAYRVFREGESNEQDEADARKVKRRTLWPTLMWDLAWPEHPPKSRGARQAS